MIQFYFKRGCPFCKRVLETLHEEIAEDFEVHYKMRHPENEKIVHEKGGKVQFPLMLDEDVVMYESDAIIAYLQKNYGSP